jgi:hypothetical protein
LQDIDIKSYKAMLAKNSAAQIEKAKLVSKANAKGVA